MAVAPRISAGSLATLFRCSFRLAGRLTDEQVGRRGSDPAMRLWSALNQALRAAHDHSWDLSAPLEEAIADAHLDVAPTELSVEEAEMYRRSLTSYLDAFGDCEIAAIHPQSGEPLRRRVKTNPEFDLTGRADLLFTYEDKPPLIRRLSLRGNPTRTLDADTDEPTIPDLALAVLLGVQHGRARNDVVLRSETLWLAANGQVTVNQVTFADVTRFRSQLYDAIDRAKSNSDATPGWWCNSCERLSNCAAVSSEPAVALLSRFDSVTSPSGP
jgi:hypothetical protein